MRAASRRPVHLALVAAGLSLASIALGHAPAAAQSQPPAARAPAEGGPAGDSGEIRQVTLTDKLIEGVLASQKEFDAIAEKLPETPQDKPDPKITAQFEAVAKKYGFASYDQYNDVVDTISLVLGGFDPATKKYVGADAVIKKQISAVEADKSIPEADRKQALQQLNDALKTPAPPIQNKANIDLVAKYYDRLSASLHQGD